MCVNVGRKTLKCVSHSCMIEAAREAIYMSTGRRWLRIKTRHVVGACLSLLVMFK